ncbi:hypothetical protein G9C85_02020 [Halorubellus sp. JP-L1]|uniref:hypothetical protein n=1 Tax=Halorubellus sp. JP-L1 TaxID=2715753 RepID=UPI00140C86D0|nr:hypothetical protein [Halorubellus sp. JP-L1]NHN40413.1 hypothetical protein [Halorubellus sp. JP-L1]
MSVIDSIKRALGGSTADEPDRTVQYRCDFCDSDLEAAYSFCPECGSERISEIA